MIKVFIIDDALLVRVTIRKILSQYSDIQIIGEAENPIDAFEEFYIKIMQEAKRFLGRRIIEEIVQEIQKVKENIGIFYVPTSVRDKLLKVFDVVIKTFC